MTFHRAVVIAGLAATLFAGLALGQGPAPQIPKAPAGRAPRGKLAFALATGFEDLQTANMMLKQVRLAKESGYLQDVVVVVYGRGVEVFDNSDARPQPTAQLIREAQAAGVPFYVCGNALHQLGIPASRLDPKPNQIVPSGIVKLAELISDGYQVIRY